jgi:hypothetical protein
LDYGCRHQRANHLENVEDAEQVESKAAKAVGLLHITDKIL